MSSGASPGPLGAVSLGLRGLQEGRKNAKTLKGKSGEGSRDSSFTTSWGGAFAALSQDFLGRRAQGTPIASRGPQKGPQSSERLVA